VEKSFECLPAFAPTSKGCSGPVSSVTFTYPWPAPPVSQLIVVVRLSVGDQNPTGFGLAVIDAAMLLPRFCRSACRADRNACI
jgi:hypothetical protein